MLQRPEVPKPRTQRLSPRPFPFSLEMMGGLASAVDAEEAADAIAVPLGAAELPGRAPGPSPSPLRSPLSMLVTDVSGEPRFSGISSRMMTAALGAAADAAVAGPAPSVADSEGADADAVPLGAAAEAVMGVCSPKRASMTVSKTSSSSVSSAGGAAPLAALEDVGAGVMAGALSVEDADADTDVDALAEAVSVPFGAAVEEDAPPRRPSKGSRRLSTASS